MKIFLTKIIATFFGTGYFPFFPGTFASFVFAILYYLLPVKLNIEIIFLFFITIIGTIAAGNFEKLSNKKDDGRIVIDEIIGLNIAFLGQTKDIKTIIILFALFRFFDIIKPFPINYVQKYKGGIGIVLDDILAGLYSNFCFTIIIYYSFGIFGL